MDLLRVTDTGLYCEAGDFFIDPWRPVDRAVITHAHSDHARWGSKWYLTTPTGRHPLRARLGEDAHIETLPFGETTSINGVKVSLHPASHVIGSAQVRVEHRGEVWVASGDYKTQPDATAEEFEPVRCHTFITESTFALPIYRWRPQEEIFAEINAWWRANAERGRTSLLYGYALGKAQRLLAGLDPAIGPILLHGAVTRLNDAYRDAGVKLPETLYAGVEEAKQHKGKCIVIAPPSAAGTPWTRKFGASSNAFASGWMMLRGTRRRRAMDRGFVMSDHADWNGVLDTIRATGCERVLATHGYAEVLTRWLREQGYEADAVQTRYTGETLEGEEDAEPPEEEEPAE